MNDQRNRVAVIADGVGRAPGVATTITQLRERGVPGYDVDVLETGDAVDRRLAALTDRRYDLMHLLFAPGPAGIAALQIGQAIALPVLASYHADPPACARARAHDPGIDEALAAEHRTVYSQCRVVLSPSRSADRTLIALGVPADRIARWTPGVDLERFSPARYAPEALPGGFNILYSGRLDREHGVELLAESFVIASVYASADLLVFPSTTDTFGQVILEAQASGLPVLAVDAGGSAELIESGRSGCLVAAEPETLASAIRGLARRETLRDRLATGGLMAARKRSWEHALTQLAPGYGRALAAPAHEAQVARAA